MDFDNNAIRCIDFLFNTIIIKCITIWLQMYRLRLKLSFVFRNKNYDYCFIIIYVLYK